MNGPSRQLPAHLALRRDADPVDVDDRDGLLWLLLAVVAGNTAGFFIVGNEVDAIALPGRRRAGSSRV